MIVEVCAAAFAMSVLGYLVPIFLQYFVYPEQNLMTKYNATWALVTGASTGIGFSLAETLASQGLNIVLIALDNNDLRTATNTLQSRFPTQKFRAVPADLSLENGTYLDEIIAATHDIHVTLIFNNAGYILTGLFADRPLSAQLHNCHVNMLSTVRLTHHFANILLDTHSHGLIAFTSSSAGFLPNPMSAMYGSTKAFLTTFATSLSSELHSQNIDILVIHPSPIASNFYANANGMESLKFFEKTAQGPSAVSACVLRCAGRHVEVDQGWFTVCVRVLLKVVDVCLLVDVARFFVHRMPDYKAMRVTRPHKEE